MQEKGGLEAKAKQQKLQGNASYSQNLAGFFQDNTRTLIYFFKLRYSQLFQIRHYQALLPYHEDAKQICGFVRIMALKA